MERPVKRRSVNSNSSNKKDHLEIIAPDYWTKPMMYRWSFFVSTCKDFLQVQVGGSIMEPTFQARVLS